MRLTGAFAVRKPSRMPGIVQRAVSDGAKLVIVGGGDGTMTSVAGSFAGNGVTLGVLPTGTGNSFARGLDVPLDLDAAVDLIAQGPTLEVDLATVNGTYFANVCSVGLSSRVGSRTPKLLKKFVGPLAYIVTGVRELFGNTAFRFRAKAADGRIFEGETQQIVIANGRMFGTSPILPEATLDDGKLSFYAVKGRRRSALAKMWLGLLLGGFHAKMDEAIFFDSPTIELTTSPARTIDVDGEFRLRTPARFEVKPKAMRVIASGVVHGSPP